MKLTIKGLPEFHGDLNKAAAIMPKIVEAAMGKSVRHIKREVQDKIISEGITFQGGLQQSVYAKVLSSFKGIVYVGKKYGIFVEKGTRPHWPPPEPIEKWARIKLGQPGLGFVISRKIARVGTPAHPFFRPAVEESVDFVEKTFSKIPEILVQTMAGK